jgi:hypothetical protein
VTLHLPAALLWALAFCETHLIYWVVLGGLVFEVRYLLRPERRTAIAMSRLGEATRREQPGFFYLLWGLHVAASAFFTLLFLGYLASLLPSTP